MIGVMYKSPPSYTVSIRSKLRGVYIIMQRAIKLFICAAVFWVGLMMLEGKTFHNRESLRVSERTSFTETVSLPYKARPLLGKPISYGLGTQSANGGKVKALSLNNKGQAAAAGNGKTIYLTFDDGPSNNTPQILDILNKEGIKATFFTLGERVARNPDIAKRIVKEGHAIGNHTYNHHYKQLYGGFEEFANQVIQTDDAIYAATGIRSTLLRAPGGTHGNFDQDYFEALEAAGYRVHDWNVDSGDSKRRGVPAKEIFANIKGSKLADTLNVLLHDSTGHVESVKALPAIIRYYKELGYSFEVLDDKVKPMQFRVAKKLKWDRSAVSEQEKARLISFGKALEVSGKRQQSSWREPALIVHRGENSLVLDREKYSLIEGSIYVPLKELTEWMGGSADLEGEFGVIEASLSGKRMFWIADSWPSAKKGEPRRIDVPLRATLGEFGFGIESYVYTEDRREVWLQV